MSNRYGYIGTAGPTQATQGKNKAYNPIKYQINIDYLVVAGGGSGGDGTAAGGGGAGGVRSTMGATGGGCSLEAKYLSEGENDIIEGRKCNAKFHSMKMLSGNFNIYNRIKKLWQVQYN